jgi:catechol 2,3-dioxygenase-like lactoylglutathione lyase family enzyme
MQIQLRVLNATQIIYRKGKEAHAYLKIGTTRFATLPQRTAGNSLKLCRVLSRPLPTNGILPPLKDRDRPAENHHPRDCSMKDTTVIPLLLALATTSSNVVMADPTMPTSSEPAGHITGIGGVFIKSKNPEALAAWYRDVLGLHLESWGGALLRYDVPHHPPTITWSAFPESSQYFAPSSQPFMINYAVDDLDAFLKNLNAKGVTALKIDSKNSFGKFAWILDPDGNKIELWQPKPDSELTK